MSDVILRGGTMDGKVLPKPLPHTFVYDVGAEWMRSIYEPTEEYDEEGRRVYQHVELDDDLPPSTSPANLPN